MRRSVAVLAVAAFVHVPSAAAWSWPVDGPVLRPFAFGNDPYAAGQHRGIDIGAPDGTTVRAASGGTVSFAGTVPAGGRTVTVRTAGGLSVTYLELGATHVVRGAEVGEGDHIGTIGSAAHVHFGVRVTADPQGYLDPLLFLPARMTPAEGLPDSVAEPSPVADPVPADPTPGVAPEPVEPIVAEPEPSPVADPPAVLELSPVAEPLPVAEPVMPADSAPTAVPPPLGTVEPVASQPEATVVDRPSGATSPVSVVELVPAEEAFPETDSAAEPSAVPPLPVAEPLLGAASSPVAAPPLDRVELVEAVPEAYPEVGEPGAVTASVWAVEPASVDELAVASDRTGPVTAVDPGELERTTEPVTTTSAPEPAGKPAIAPAQAEPVNQAEPGSRAAEPVATSPGPPSLVPVVALPAPGLVAAEASPPAAAAARTESVPEPLLPKAVTGTELPVPPERLPVTPVMGLRAAPDALTIRAESSPAVGAGSPRSLKLAVVKVRPRVVVTSRPPETPARRGAVDSARAGESDRGSAAGSRAAKPAGDTENPGVAPAALVGLLALGLLGAFATARRMRCPGGDVPQVPPTAQSVMCPLGRMRAPRLIHGCARVSHPGRLVPVVRPRRVNPRHGPLPRPPRRVPAGTRA